LSAVFEAALGWFAIDDSDEHSHFDQKNNFLTSNMLQM